MGCISVKSTTEDNVLAAEPGLFHHRYQLGRCVGKGSQGTVFLATNCNTGGMRAVKITSLRAYGMEADPKFKAEQFCNQQNVWVQAGQHPNICCLQEWYLDSSFAYSVMECCPNSLLSAWKNEQHLNECTYANYFKDMASALAHIHSLGVVHRDVKHDNFLLGGPLGRTTMLCDFGLAALASDRSVLMKKERGTPPYMAPEMLKPGAVCGPACDVWSFGVIVYMAFFGCWPYPSKEKTSKAMKEAISSATRPPPFSPPAGFPQTSVSDAALDFVRALLDRNSDTRPSASECLKREYLFDKDRRAISVAATDLAKMSLSEMLDGAVCCAAVSTREPRADPLDLLVLQMLQDAAKSRRAARLTSGKTGVDGHGRS